MFFIKVILLTFPESFCTVALQFDTFTEEAVCWDANTPKSIPSACRSQVTV